METVVITGASSGIGESLAIAFASPGRRLVLIARREALLEEVAKQCRAKGAYCQVVAADLAQPKGLDLGGILGPYSDLTLIHNAGAGRFGPAANVEVESMDLQLNVNLRAPMLLNAQVLPGMLAAGCGQIIHILSMAATHTLPNASVYSASKAGLLAYAKSLAVEVRSFGIRVINVLPGATATPIWGENGPPKEDMIKPAELAALVFHLANSPKTLSTDEVLVMPPKGIL